VQRADDSRQMSEDGSQRTDDIRQRTEGQDDSLFVIGWWESDPPSSLKGGTSVFAMATPRQDGAASMRKWEKSLEVPSIYAGWPVEF
jgi:hypothetical protein